MSPTYRRAKREHKALKERTAREWKESSRPALWQGYENNNGRHNGKHFKFDCTKYAENQTHSENRKGIAMGE